MSLIMHLARWQWFSFHKRRNILCSKVLPIFQVFFTCLCWQSLFSVKWWYILLWVFLGDPTSSFPRAPTGLWFNSTDNNGTLYWSEAASHVAVRYSPAPFNIATVKALYSPAPRLVDGLTMLFGWFGFLMVIFCILIFQTLYILMCFVAVLVIIGEYLLTAQTFTLVKIRKFLKSALVLVRLIFANSHYSYTFSAFQPQVRWPLLLEMILLGVLMVSLQHLEIISVYSPTPTPSLCPFFFGMEGENNFNRF